MSYHLTPQGPKRCSALNGHCPYGGEHYPNLAKAKKGYEKLMEEAYHHPLVMSHGQMVRKGEVSLSGFLKEIFAKEKGNRRFQGSDEELLRLVKANMAHARPGTGSLEGDVLLVPLPPKGFFTSTVELTPENRDRVEILWEARVEGEAPVPVQVLRSESLEPAKYVDAVIYRADTLARDNDRSSDAEWELVSLNTRPEEEVPMRPTTMVRNALRKKGGTYREYTNEEWAKAVDFWQNHAILRSPLE